MEPEPIADDRELVLGRLVHINPEEPVRSEPLLDRLAVEPELDRPVLIDQMAPRQRNWHRWGSDGVGCHGGQCMPPRHTAVSLMSSCLSTAVPATRTRPDARRFSTGG
jgi:hypothetical protein